MPPSLKSISDLQDPPQAVRRYLVLNAVATGVAPSVHPNIIVE